MNTLTRICFAQPGDDYFAVSRRRVSQAGGLVIMVTRLEPSDGVK